MGQFQHQPQHRQYHRDLVFLTSIHACRIRNVVRMLLALASMTAAGDLAGVNCLSACAQIGAPADVTFLSLMGAYPAMNTCQTDGVCATKIRCVAVGIVGSLPS